MQAKHRKKKEIKADKRGEDQGGWAEQQLQMSDMLRASKSKDTVQIRCIYARTYTLLM